MWLQVRKSALFGNTSYYVYSSKWLQTSINSLPSTDQQLTVYANQSTGNTLGLLLGTLMIYKEFARVKS